MGCPKKRKTLHILCDMKATQHYKCKYRLLLSKWHQMKTSSKHLTENKLNRIKWFLQWDSYIATAKNYTCNHLKHFNASKKPNFHNNQRDLSTSFINWFDVLDSAGKELSSWAEQKEEGVNLMVSLWQSYNLGTALHFSPPAARHRGC